jgi:folate-dependent phosphoribosylglycinamide formyltransferase PurN
MGHSLYIITTEDPLWSDRLIESVIRAYPGQVKGIGLSGGLLTKKRLLMSPFIYGFFRYALLGAKVVWSMCFGGKIAKVAKKHGIPVDDLHSVKDGKLHSILVERGIDLMISVNCSQKLREREFSAPRLGTINIHNSALPEYRGLMPILHAIREGRSENGITVHEINAQLDDGAILAQEHVPLGPRDDLLRVWERCVDRGCEMLPRVMEQVLQGETDKLPNDASRSSYFSFPTWEQIRGYRRALRERRRG